MARGIWNVLGEIVGCIQDFEGQRRAQRIYLVLITVVTLLGFFVTCITRQFYFTGWAAVFSTVLAELLVAPNWPYLRRNPLKWADYSKKKD